MRQQVPGITIDSWSTRDMDDAIWVERQPEGWLVKVSIADVEEFVGVDTAQDDRAWDRVATQYYATGNSPMLDRALSEGTLSLWPDEAKKTLTVDFEVNLSGDVTSAKVYPSICVSQARLDYDKVPGIKAEEGHPQHGVIVAALELAFLLLQKRRDSGAMVAYDLATGWVLTEDGYLKQMKHRDETVGYILIQELMVATNAVVANYALANDIPVLFRNHTPLKALPDRQEVIAQLEAAFTSPVSSLELEQRRLQLVMGKAQYGATLKGHYGLNLPAYLHFTSPIRRYADLVVHRQIKAFLNQTELPYSQADLEAEGQRINARLLEIQTERAAASKAQADRRADRVSDDERKLDGLRPKDFERVCKLQTRSEGDPSTAFAANYLLRLSEGRVPLVCQTQVLVGAPETEAWKPLRQAILDRLGTSLGDVASLLTQASAIFDWPEIGIEATVFGVGAPQYVAKARLQIKGRLLLVGGPAQAGSLKVARARAILNVLATLYGLTPPSTPKPSAPDPKALEGQNVVSVLNEYCLVNHIPLPVYEYVNSGTPTSPKFTCTCSAVETTGTGEGTSKQRAKEEAARNILNQL